jgi:hypothetical protein
MRNAIVAAVLCCLIASMAALHGCTKTSPISASPNQPPETTLTFTGASGPDGSRQVTLRWSGTDEDGSVDHWLVRLDSSDWRKVTCTETVYVFPAPGKHSRAVCEEERHCFSVKSVDDRGSEDPTPAVAWFTPRNNLPETEIVDGPASVTGPMVFIEWIGHDTDGEIAAYDYRLFRWEYSEWIQVVPDPAVAPSVTVGPEVTTVLFGPLAGQHRFEVWATDNEGGVDPTPAEIIFACNPELAGALLTVETNVLGEYQYRGPVWHPSHNTPMDVFQELLTFDWSASAEDYGGEVVGYRHAWDDTTSWPAWSLSDTCFSVTPEPGEHSLYIQAIDNANVATRARIFIDVIEPDLSQYILVVDDYDSWETNPEWGSDADRDAFYDSLLCDCDRPTVQWAPSFPSVIPDVATLAGASTVVWHTDSTPEALSAAFDQLYDGYRPLAGYMRAGGNLILGGFENLRVITGEQYPIMVTAQDESYGAVFMRDYLRIGYALSSGSNANKDVPWEYGYCFYGAVPGGTGIPLERMVDLEPVFVDSLGKWGHMYSSPMENYRHCGLPMVEALEAYGPGIEAHVIDSFLNMDFEGRTCIVLSPTGTHDGNVCYFGFGLYYLQTPQVKALFDQLMAMFGEMAEVPGAVDG